MNSIKIPLPTLGVDLLSGETGVAEGAVRSADNVDIRRDGTFKRRGGYEVKVAGADFHSLAHTTRGTIVARGQRVYALDTNTFTPSLLCEMGADAPVDFHEHNGHLYFTNPGSIWWVPSDESGPRRVGVRLPEAMPDLAPNAAGALLPGRYVVALSRVDDRGEESATKLVGSVDLPAGGGILLTGLPVDLECAYRAYLSPPDGDALYLSEEFSGAFSQFLLTRPADGAIRTSQHLAPMPAGEFVRGHAGRLYVMSGDTLYFSQPLRAHLHDPRHDFIKFSGQGRFLEAVAGGLYVGDDRGVWFLPGNDPDQFQLRNVSRVAPVRRSAVTLSGAHFNQELVAGDGNVVVWLSEEGYILGRASGETTPLHPERVRVAAGLEGRSRFVVRDGVKQIITLAAATTAPGFGVATDTSMQ